MEQLGQFIINHWGLWVALIIILLLILINEHLNQKKKAKELPPSSVVEKMNHDDATVIDLRDDESFRAGHIIGAIRANADDFQQKRMDKFKTKPFILVCARGIQSSTLASKLRAQGFEQPMVLSGGMTAWVSDNFPIVKGKN